MANLTPPCAVALAALLSCLKPHEFSISCRELRKRHYTSHAFLDRMCIDSLSEAGVIIQKPIPAEASEPPDQQIILQGESCLNPSIHREEILSEIINSQSDAVATTAPLYELLTYLLAGEGVFYINFLAGERELNVIVDQQGYEQLSTLIDSYSLGQILILTKHVIDQLTTCSTKKNIKLSSLLMFVRDDIYSFIKQGIQIGYVLPPYLKQPSMLRRVLIQRILKLEDQEDLKSSVRQFLSTS